MSRGQEANGIARVAEDLAADHRGQQRIHVVRQIIAAPGDVLVGTDQRELALIEFRCFAAAATSRMASGTPALAGRGFKAGRIGRRAGQAEQREIEPETVEQRTPRRPAVVEPQMRRPAARDA